MSDLSLGELFYGKEQNEKILDEKLKSKINEVESSLDETIKSIPKCIIQLFLKKEEKYYADSTAVLIELNNQFFVFSASHCIQDNSYIIHDREFIELPVIWSIQSILDKDSSEDIYIAELSKKIDFIDREYYQISLNDIHSYGNCIIGFSGFPYTKNGKKWEKLEFKNRPYFYWGQSELLEEKNYDNNRHLKMPQDRKKMLSNIGGHVNIAPSPKGISGGTIFKLANNIESISKGFYDVKLIGIGIENREQQDKSLIGHTLSHFLNIMMTFNKLNVKNQIGYSINKDLYTYIKK